MIISLTEVPHRGYFTAALLSAAGQLVTDSLFRGLRSNRHCVHHYWSRRALLLRRPTHTQFEQCMATACTHIIPHTCLNTQFHTASNFCWLNCEAVLLKTCKTVVKRYKRLTVSYLSCANLDTLRGCVFLPRKPHAFVSL